MGADLYYRVSVSAAGAAYDLSADVVSLTVDQRDAEPDALTLHVGDPSMVFGSAIQEGMDVEVELGTAEDHSVVFRGRFYQVEGTFPEDGDPALDLKAYDRSMKMGLRKRNRAFTNITLSNLVTQVASPYFNGNVTVTLLGDPLFDARGVRQHEETDLAFLKRLAAAYGCVLYTSVGETSSGDAFNFIAQQQVMTTAPDLTLYYRRSGVEYALARFSSSVDVSQLQLSRSFSGIDYDTGADTGVTTASVAGAGSVADTFQSDDLAAFQATQPDQAAQIGGLLGAASAAQTALLAELGTAERAGTPAFVTPAQLAEIAKNQLSVSLLGMRASGSLAGTKAMAARKSVQIQDVGARFSGTWYLSQVRHVLSREGYRTEFECQR